MLTAGQWNVKNAGVHHFIHLFISVVHVKQAPDSFGSEASRI